MQSIAKLIATPLLLTLLPGYFIFVDDYDDDDDTTVIVVEETNSAPEILPTNTWWTCDYDGPANAYFFEFQATWTTSTDSATCSSST